MRDYGKVGPKFWIGETGKALRKQGIEAQLVALYLMTGPHSNMLGLYYIPQMFIAHETGLGFEGAMKGLIGCIEARFCEYDEESEMVWVYEMATYQIADSLKDKDLRVKGVQNEYDSVPANPYLEPFFEKYSVPFLMSTCRKSTERKQAPFKPLASQEQEQEQKQEKEQKQEQKACAASAASKKNTEPKEEPNPLNSETWISYKQAYTNRYTVPPVRDAAVNSKIKAIVKALGAEAPQVAAFFVSHNGSRYVAGMHQIGFLATDYAKLRTEWATDTRMTTTKAAQTDRTQTNFDAFAPLIAEAERKEREQNGE